MMEREKRLRGIVFLGGRSDYTPEELTMLNVPFVCCSYANQYGTLPEGSYASVSIADEEGGLSGRDGAVLLRTPPHCGAGSPHR